MQPHHWVGGGGRLHFEEMYFFARHRQWEITVTFFLPHKSACSLFSSVTRLGKLYLSRKRNAYSQIQTTFFLNVLRNWGKKVIFSLTHHQNIFSILVFFNYWKNDPNKNKKFIKVYLNFSIQNYHVKLGAIKQASEMPHLEHVTFNCEIKANFSLFSPCPILSKQHSHSKIILEL